MQLSPRGTILAWFGLVMLIIGFIFQSDVILLLAAVSLGTLALSAVIFRKQCNSLRGNITVTIDPSVAATVENVSVKLNIALTNSSQIPTRLVGVRPTLPAQVREMEKATGLPRVFLANSTVTYAITVQALASGLFTLSNITATVEDRTSLFRERIRMNCRWALEVSPRLAFSQARMETTDPTRAGAVSDIAGVREALSIDDFHTIDWKTTARTGKFMAKQFFRESAPPAIIAVEREVLIEGLRSKNNVLLTIAQLLVSFSPSARIGLAIYDTNSVLVYFPPTAGTRALQQMITALINATTESTTQPNEYVTRLYSDLASMVRGMKSTAVHRTHRSIDVFARNLLPYYENSLAKHTLKLRKQGAFEALSTIAQFPQPSLVIAISGFSHDVSGLCEGVLTTNAAGHYVAVAIIGGRENLSPELTQLRHIGILVIQGGGPELLSAIRNGLQSVQRIKTRTLKTQ